MWILRLKRFFLRKFFIVNKALVVVFNQNHLDKSFTPSGWILNFQVHDGIIFLKKEKNAILRWKPEKGGLERKRENFWRLMGRANERSTIGKHPKPLWGPQSLPKPENLNILFKTITMGFDVWSNHHIQGLEKWIF